MKKVRVLPEFERPTNQVPCDKPNVFIFYNKTTGATQFHTEAAGSEEESVERAAGLLAIQCLVRGHNPDDFTILVPAANAVSARLVARANDLLAEGRAISGPAPLSPRQKEILQSVLRHQANKEIASRLNITVRTVKFHISSLLSKFDVRSRGELARKAASILGTCEHQVEAMVAVEPPSASAAYSPIRDLMMNSEAVAGFPDRTVRFPGRMRTA